MATVYAPRIRATDANGAPKSGATLTIYEAGTTTLAAVYSNASLTTPRVNPVVADSAGWFPQIFCAEGATLDFVPSAGWTGAALEVQGLGGETNTFSRNFTDSRVQIRNAGGVVQIETGNAEGDEIGGSGRLGGWDGTQGDALNIDYASISTTGELLPEGKELPGLVQSTSTTSGAATVVIALPNTPTGCRRYDVDITDIACTGGGGNIALTFSTDNGATYIATSYFSVYSRDLRGSTANGGSNNAVSALIGVTGAVDAASSIDLVVRTPNGAGTGQVSGVYHGDDVGAAGSEAATTRFNVSRGSLSARITHVKLTFPASVSCRYRVRPQRGFGE